MGTLGHPIEPNWGARMPRTMEPKGPQVNDLREFVMTEDMAVRNKLKMIPKSLLSITGCGHCPDLILP